MKVCMFDLDGTLLDTVPAIMFFLNQTIAVCTDRPLCAEEIKVFVGNGARKLVTRALKSRGVTDEKTVEKMLAAYNAAYDAHPYDLTSPYPGVSELLAELKARGFRLAVISNKPDSTARAVVEHFFPGVFDLIRGGREGYPLKPAPDVPLAMLRELDASPAETFYFGDTATDMQTGHAMGCAKVFGLLWGFRSEKELTDANADVLLTKPSDFLPYINQ